MEKSHRTFDWDRLLRWKRRRRILTMAVLAVMLPFVLGLFYAIFHHKHYLLFSLILLFLIMGAFFANFERRHPGAREVVLTAVVTSLTVAANEICAHTVPVHAGTAMVVLSGIALGPEAGFLIGALSRFLCNFFDGQGPWTPWQMAAWGLIGYLAGLLFNAIEHHSKLEKQSLAQRLTLHKNRTFRILAGPILCVAAFLLAGYLFFLFFHEPGESFWGWRIYVFGTLGMAAGAIFQRKRLPVDTVTVTVYTFLSVLLLYGGIMNFAALLMETSFNSVGESISMDALKALYVAGFPYDAAHAGGASLCVFLFGDRVLQRLDRIRTKFGIVF